MVHLTFIFALIFTFPDLNKKYPFHFFTFAILYLFLALRYDYGNDYMGYYRIHEALQVGLPAWGESDVLFKYLNLLIPNFYVLIAITSMFYMMTIYYLITRNLKIKQYWFGILILLITPTLFLIHLSSIRQTLAISFFILAVTFAIKRKPILYIFVTLIGVGMHASAIILLPLYFILTERKLNNKLIVIIYVFLVALMATPLFEIIIYKIMEYLPLPDHYIRLYEMDIQNSLRSTLLSSFYFFLVILNINKLEGKKIIYGKLYLIGTIISILAFEVALITRIAMYFNIFAIVVIPLIFEKIESRFNKRILFIIMLTIYILRYYSFFTTPMWESFYNYRTILGK